MVHALLEAHRVLKTKGLLIDLRPASVHRRVGVTQGDGYQLLWVMREKFDDDRAADRAVKEVENEGWFKAERRTRFACYRIMDSLDEFQEWLADFVHRSWAKDGKERMQREKLGVLPGIGFNFRGRRQSL